MPVSWRSGGLAVNRLRARRVRPAGVADADASCTCTPFDGVVVVAAAAAVVKGVVVGLRVSGIGPAGTSW
eukprot:COSAG01_NODE_4996_length_4559_cov_1.847309_5_plen_70_part_00